MTRPPSKSGQSPTIEERVAELLIGVPPLSDEQVRAASQILKAARRSMPTAVEPPDRPPKLTYTLPEAAEAAGCGVRWLEDECRAGRFEHVKFNNRRRMTLAQIELVIERLTERAVAPKRAAPYIPPAKRRPS